MAVVIFRRPDQFDPARHAADLVMFRRWGEKAGAPASKHAGWSFEPPGHDARLRAVRIRSMTTTI